MAAFEDLGLKLIQNIVTGKIIFGMSQRLVLRPFLFNIDMCDLFLFITESNLANCAFDTTLYEC